MYGEIKIKEKNSIGHKTSMDDNDEDEEILINFVKNKFKLLLKDTKIIQNIIKDFNICKIVENSQATSKENSSNLMEIFSYLIKHVLKTTSNLTPSDIIYQILCHLLYMLKLNEYWILFKLPIYFPNFISTNTSEFEKNELKLRNSLNDFLIKQGSHTKEDFLIFLDENIIQKISYPLNSVICETILTNLFQFNSKNMEILNDFDIYLSSLIKYSNSLLNVDEITFYYIFISLIYERTIKTSLINHTIIDTKLFKIYIDVLNKLIKILKEIQGNQNDMNLMLDKENKIILEAIRFQKSKKIFERISRIILDYKNWFFNEEENFIILISKLLFISFEAQ